MRQLLTHSNNSQLLDTLGEVGVKFLVTGGMAVKFYAPQREADDLDLLISPDHQNLTHLRSCLNKLGFHQNLDKLLNRMDTQVVLKSYFWADLLIKGTVEDFEDLWANSELGSVNGISVHFVSKDDLLAEKMRSQRDKDELDLPLLHASNH